MRSLQPPTNWHELEVSAAARALRTSEEQGLSNEEAAQRAHDDGYNELPIGRRRSRLAILLAQVTSPLIYLLLAAAVIALALGERSDAAVIAVVVVLNAIIGALQEDRAERALEALRTLAAPHARVVRAGAHASIACRELVPGDLVCLEAGDAVPADLRLSDAPGLTVSEAALTGESVPVGKRVATVAAGSALTERSNMLYAGTLVMAGRARGLVTATGLQTELGHVASLTASAVQPKTPLEKRVQQLGRVLAYVALALFVVIIPIGLVRGIPLDQLVMVCVSQLVGLVPEGLPVAMTVALAVGVQRMARRNVVVRRLSAVETLGATTVICTDKTGTLTRNEMRVTVIVDAEGRELEVGEPTLSSALRTEVQQRPPLRTLLEAAVLCNEAQLRSASAEAPVCALGDPTEIALLSIARAAGVSLEDVRAVQPRQAELPFDTGAKLMATQHGGDDGPCVYLKGAPEELLALLVEGRDGSTLRAAAERLAARGLRVLAVGVGRGVRLAEGASFECLRGKIVPLGLFAQIDPPRAEVAHAVKRCMTAGIRPVMLTGDHQRTGAAIARQLGIVRERDESLDGRRLEMLSEDELEAHLDHVSVFARVQPAQKLRIVTAFQRRGHVVAMTGDGVNDAPALRAADVGVAMGKSGSEVAKEAAKIVIGDDNFASIVAAVEEGRVVYRNIKKAVVLLVSTSVAEVFVLLLALVFGYAPPFFAVQILWNNLVTEGLVTVNLVMEPGEGDEMSGPPPPVDEPLLSRASVPRMLLMIVSIVSVTLGWFVARHAAGVPTAQVCTETFTLLALCEWFNVLNCRSQTRSALNLTLLKNPWLLGGLLLGNALQFAVVFWRPLGRVFHTVPFGAREVLALGALASLVLWVEEARKWVERRGLTKRVTPRA